MVQPGPFDFVEVAEVMGYYKSETHFTLAAGRRGFIAPNTLAAGRRGFIAPKRQTDGAGSQIYLVARRWKITAA